jgi:LmbE family N-acetylglucosaminyl deacetylase
MKDLSHFGRILVIAPHPDDEILGCGGTMARLVDEGAEVVVAIVTTGQPPAFPPERTALVEREMRQAHEIIGIRDCRFLGLPAAALDTVPAAALNAKFQELIADVRPDTLLLPFVGDIHSDHQLSFLAAMVAARPRHADAPSLVMCYETLSETNWYAAPTTPAFVPNAFVDVSAPLDRKLKAFEAIASQLRPFPEERSIEALRALATLRGATVHLQAAEAFMIVRQIWRS